VSTERWTRAKRERRGVPDTHVLPMNIPTYYKKKSAIKNGNDQKQKKR